MPDRAPVERLTPEMRKRIGGWAAKQEDKPPRSVAIRRLIEMSLAERRAGKRSK